MESKENQNDVTVITSIEQYPEAPTDCKVKVMRSYPLDYGFDFLSPNSTTVARKTVEETVSAKTWRTDNHIEVLYRSGLMISYSIEDCPVVELGGRELKIHIL